LTKKDRDTREYGAGIYVTPDGVVRRTELFEGPKNGGTVTIEFRIPRGSRIVGDVHSHPRETFNSDNSEPSSSDWDDTDDNYFGDPPFADASNFAMYILSPRDKFGEFDYNSGRPKKSSASNIRDAKSECK